MTDTVTCLVCSKKFKSLSTTHLKTHNLSFDDYKNQFPGAPIKSDKTKAISTNTLENMIRLYGKEGGQKAFDQYVRKQSETNTFEYKSVKYGWTLEDFKKYNDNRACTLKNFIKRHGDQLGREKWEAYCERQRYAGVDFNYFVEKYGEIEGAERYNRMLDKKIHNYHASSNVASELFAAVDIDNNCIYSPKTDEYKFKTSSIKRRAFFVDLYNPFTKRVIEFYGDYWHCNPQKYTEEFVSRTGRTAKEQWDKDYKRIDEIEREFDVKVMIVWENDYRKNKELVIERAKKFIYE